MDRIGTDQETFASEFQRDGFGIIKGLLDPQTCTRIRRVVINALDPLQAPVEYEAEVGYPGSPKDRIAPGGLTPRRLLYAYSRHEVFRHLATHPAITKQLQQLFGKETLLISQCHHNCVMTKHPGYSSTTSWHRDIRYWSFDKPELVSVWFALGEERAGNGALSVIPSSHRLTVDRDRLDQVLFLRPELEENQALIAKAQLVALNPGDVLFFHSQLFHTAEKNTTDQVKLSAVFAYHSANNYPIPETRSNQHPSIPLQTIKT